MFFPINIVHGNFQHWVGALVDLKQKQISIWDSFILEQGTLQDYDHNHELKFKNVLKVMCDV